MNKEIWKFIPNYDEMYQGSNWGRIKSFKQNKEIIRKIVIDKHGYGYVILYNDGITKRFAVHRLVGKLFIPNPENKPCINHKNGIKHDNRVENLEWCTYSENSKHFMNVLDKDDEFKEKIKAHSISYAVRQLTLDDEEIEIFDSINDAHKKTEICYNHIKRVCNGFGNTAGGYKWEYVSNHHDREAISNYKVEQRNKVNNDLINTFDGYSDASRKTGIGITGIRNVCIGKQKTSGGYKWNVVFNENEVLSNDKGNFKSSLATKIQQLDINNREIINTFESISDASRKTGISKASISNTCSGKQKTAGGFFWRKLERNIIIQQLDLVTGDIINTFKSYEEAGEKIGMKWFNISNVCVGISKSAGGYFWKRVEENILNNDTSDVKMYEVKSLEGETWKEVPDSEGCYKLSNFGRVMTLKNNKVRLMVYKVNKKTKHRTVEMVIRGKKKCFYVHKLVAELFIPHENKKDAVIHIDNDKSNNVVENLKWISHSELNKK